MKRLLVLALVFVAGAAMAGSLGMPNLLLSPGFEEAGDYWGYDLGPGWTNSGSPGYQVIFPGWYWGAGPRTGAKAAGLASNYGVQTGLATQIIPVDFGEWTVDLTGWVWIFDNSNDWGWDTWLKATLTVDGVPVASQTVSSMTHPMEQWVPIQIIWQGPVMGYLDLHLEGRADGQGGGGWGVLSTDDWDLEIGPIPEPSSLLALLTGVAGLGGLALRRR